MRLSLVTRPVTRQESLADLVRKMPAKEGAMAKTVMGELGSRRGWVGGASAP